MCFSKNNRPSAKVFERGLCELSRYLNRTNFTLLIFLNRLAMFTVVTPLTILIRPIGDRSPFALVNDWKRLTQAQSTYV